MFSGRYRDCPFYTNGVKKYTDGACDHSFSIRLWPEHSSALYINNFRRVYYKTGLVLFDSENYKYCLDNVLDENGIYPLLNVQVEVLDTDNVPNNDFKYTPDDFITKMAFKIDPSDFIQPRKLCVSSNARSGNIETKSTKSYVLDFDREIGCDDFTETPFRMRLEVWLDTYEIPHLRKKPSASCLPAYKGRMYKSLVVTFNIFSSLILNDFM